MNLAARSGLLYLLATLVTACGLSGEDRVTPIGQAIADDLTATTTTSTTTTTTTTTVPTSTEPSGTPDDSTTTTTPLTVTAPVDLFYVFGATDDLQRITLQLPAGLAIPQLILELEQPADEVRGFNARTAVRQGLIADVTLERGLATVVLNQEVYNGMSGTEVNQAIAQIVLTLTLFRTTNEGAIGQVRFESDSGAPISVFLPSLGTTSEPGQAVAFTDFSSRVIDAPSVPTTTTTTSHPPLRPDCGSGRRHPSR